MLDTYFFIPGDKPNYFKKINELNADFFVIDLEDAVSINNKLPAIDLVQNFSITKDFFIRIPFFDNCYSDKQIYDLIKKFDGQIVLPKIETVEDVENIVLISRGLPLNMIVLVENPRSFINVLKILEKYAASIHAIGFGSHDFCSSTGIKHVSKNLEFYKQQLILFSKAFSVKYLDGVDLNLHNFETFKQDCLFAYEAGADGKFLIHPRQLDEMNKVKFITDDELCIIKSLYDEIKNMDYNEIDVLKIDGIVYEKPHILNIIRIMSKLQKSNN